MLRPVLFISVALTLVFGVATAAIADPAPSERAIAAQSVSRAHDVLPAPIQLQLPTLAVPAAPAAPTWTINIDTAGHQDELDQCLWVRMNFSSTAVPFVGKHNYCGGDVVLDMTWGQTVQLTGLGLDGTYMVTGDRVAFSGALPGEAVAGMSATVFLQTCYYDLSQGMRLVSLTLLPETPRVVVGAS